MGDGGKDECGEFLPDFFSRCCSSSCLVSVLISVTVFTGDA
jgi:hypothetical protein